MGAERVILGTAQFGLSYGISNDGGRVARNEVADILSLASAEGVPALDTAAAYGDSEAVLGSLAESRPFAITTKTVPIRAAALTHEDVARVEERFHRSLAQLQRSTVDTLLVHDAGDLLADGGERLWNLLESIRRDGKARRIGVSVYDGTQIAAVTAKFPVEVVQLPVNALDQRLLLDGSLARLRASGVSVQARSAFLQGLMLMAPSEVAEKLPHATAIVARWQAACESAGITPLAAALAFVLAQPEIDHVVLGVHSREHLAECLAAVDTPAALPWNAIACNDPEVVDPRRWAA
jgi:aryl-alcohol dehydrogenase-like predicted oxidoreductase